MPIAPITLVRIATKLIGPLCLVGLSLFADAEASAVSEACGKVPLASAISASAPLEVLESHFTLRPDRSISSVLFRNRTTKPITEVLLLIEYIGRDNNHVLTGVYYGAQKRPLTLPLRTQDTWGVLKLEEPINPGSEAALTYVSEITAFKCPTKAVLTRVSVTFGDATTWSEASAGWSTDPVIREAQGVDTTTFPAGLPFVLSATIRVDRTGHPKVLRTSASTAEVSTWLQIQLEKWSIVPGDGAAVADVPQVLPLILRLHSRSSGISVRDERLELGGFHRPAVIVDVRSSQGTVGQSSVMIGGMVASQHALVGTHQ